MVVPRDMIPAFLRKTTAIGKETQVRIRSFGHAGDGNLHIYVCRDELPEEAWQEKVSHVMAELYAAAREMGGEVSGEHGIGHAKKAFLRKSKGDTQMRLMAGIKAVFDPNGILNPGKIV